MDMEIHANHDSVADLRRQVDEKLRFKTSLWGFEKTAVNEHIQNLASTINHLTETTKASLESYTTEQQLLVDKLKDRDELLEELEACQALTHRQLDECRQQLAEREHLFDELKLKMQRVVNELAVLSRSVEVQAFEKMRVEVENSVREKGEISVRLSMLEKEREIMRENNFALSTENNELKTRLLDLEIKEKQLRHECRLASGGLSSLANIQGGDISARLRETLDLLNSFFGTQSQCIASLKNVCEVGAIRTHHDAENIETE